MLHLDPKRGAPAPPERQSPDNRRVIHLPADMHPNLHLRPVEPADAGPLSALFSHPEVSVCLSVRPQSVTAFENWILLSRARHAEHRSDCCSVVSDTSEVVGLFMGSQSQALADTFEIGMVLAPHLWGTGAFEPAARQYLDRVFAAWPGCRVVCRILVRNQRGMAALRKLGGRQIGSEARGSDLEYLWEIPRQG